MGDRKQPGRFTIQFNLEDPRQRSAAELLDRQGRRKAQFLTEAVLSYVQAPAPKRAAALPGLDEKTLERMVLAILEKHAQAIDAGQAGAGTETAPPEDASPAVEAWNAGALSAISNTLAAFQSK